MNNKEKILFGSASFLLGLGVGVFLSSIKRIAILKGKGENELEESKEEINESDQSEVGKIEENFNVDDNLKE